ncbi:BTAD domain-containing putative transcriptional regulator [Streptomyces sp. NPDC052052]|uniref:AfsR/SARP family transcriptional regulator n=1 Tax=Streptomyces sp. NPDC052052 TaxID=3154756 RepID=UPI003424D234
MQPRGVQGAGADETGVRFNVLGPLEAWLGGERLRLGGAIQERVLVMLLLEAGRVLPVSRLVAAAWDEEPPATAAHQVRKTIADLRRRIPGGGGVLVTDGPGYRAVLGKRQLDLSEFDAAVREAAGAGRPAEAVEKLGSALALWRGPVLSGQGGAVIAAAAVALDERRLMASEQLIELRLTLGHAAELIGEIRKLAAHYPLREALRGQLMRALYRTGRRAEALEEYQAVRVLLAEELGVDPGPHLTKVYEAILRESPELLASEQELAPTVQGPAEAERPTPHDLPYDLPDFTGRERELRELMALARVAHGHGGMPIVAIDGMGGSGKTSLVVRAAHRLAVDYPDGQIHVDLRGYTPGEQSVTAMAALDVLLRAMGVPGERIPEDIAGRTALWRSTMGGKRVLLLLDNAVDVSAVLPLLPASPGCLVLVTSRVRLVDLDGAAWLSIGVMTPQESAVLVARTVGAARVAAEPEAAEELARLCGHLPLALRIATARFRNRPQWTMRYLADRLRDETRRMDELSLGERSVAATLRLSYQALDERCRTAFRLLALHPGGDLDPYAAGALLGMKVWDAEDILEVLLDAHLLQQPEIGIYSFHDLVRTFARGLRSASSQERDDQAVTLLLDYYLARTDAACEQLFPGRVRRPTGLDRSPVEFPRDEGAGQAESWFRREHSTLFAVIALAVTHGHDRHAVWLARNFSFQLNAHGYLEEFAEASRTAVAAARRLDDLALIGVSLTNLGVACWKLGDLTEGIEVAREGRDVARRLGDRHTEAHSESILGGYMSLYGRFAEALVSLEQAIATGRELGSVRDEAECLTLLSTLYEQWGHYEDALTSAQRAVALARQIGHHEIELVALTDLAFAHFGLSAFEEADRALACARELCEETREPGQRALALMLSALTAHQLGRTEQESAYAEQARPLMDTTVSPLRRAKGENLTGRLLRRQGRHESARAAHTRAYEIASPMGYRVEEAYALLGMADAAQALGDDEAAARHRRSAEGWFTEAGVAPERRRS